jgi:hypothetical protein
MLTFYGWFYFSQADIDFLDSRPEIMNWLTLAPSIFIVSERSAYDLAAIFRERYPSQQFVVTKIIRGENDGWLPQNIWDFLNDPKPGQGKGPKFPDSNINRILEDLLKITRQNRRPGILPYPPEEKNE